jgi:hypothetical protein
MAGSGGRLKRYVESVFKSRCECPGATMGVPLLPGMIGLLLVCNGGDCKAVAGAEATASRLEELVLFG